jgi:hypothetical protein
MQKSLDPNTDDVLHPFMRTTPMNRGVNEIAGKIDKRDLRPIAGVRCEEFGKFGAIQVF